MPIDKFIIGYTDDKSGYQTNVLPWLLPDNAFEVMKNAYTWRGRVRKRVGSVLMGANANSSRLRIPNIPIVITAPGPSPEIGQVDFNLIPITIAVGMKIELQGGTNTTFTVVDIAGALLSTNPNPPFLTSVTATIAGNVLTITNNTVPLVALPLTINLYPALPVTGIGQYENSATNDETTVAFDTKFAYYYSGTAWVRLTTGADVWTGTNSDLFWITNYRGVTASENYLWVTNFVPADGIRYRTSIATAPAQWRKPTLFYSKGTAITTTNAAGAVPAIPPFFVVPVPLPGDIFIVGSTALVVPAATGDLLIVPLTTSSPCAQQPGTTIDLATGQLVIIPSATPCLNTSVYYSHNFLIKTARIVLQFKNRLILLNTVEQVGTTDTSFRNRCRYSAVGNPLFASIIGPPAINTSVSFMEDLPGFGNAIDAATQEAIVSAEFLKDRLIVYFERSTWELVYTGNQIYPFTWQKINTELGCESTFSTIPFDKTVLGFGNVGIHSCTGANVVRIDEKIPDLVFGLHNLQAGVDRVVGIRNYQPEIAIWTYPGGARSTDFPYPNNMLIYNYVNNSWAIFNDSYTFFGYYQTSLTDPSSAATWGSSNTLWGQTLDLWGGSVGTTNSIKSLRVIGGNQQGWLNILDYSLSVNAASLQITGISAAGGTVNGLVGSNAVFIWSVDHNLEAGDFIAVDSLTGIVISLTTSDVPPLSYNLFRVVGQVATVVSKDQVQVVFNRFNTITDTPEPIVLTGTYVGQGQITRISLIKIDSKDFNLYLGKDYNAYISRINFMVNRTVNGYIKVNYNLNTASGVSLPQDTSALLGNSQLTTFAYPSVTTNQGIFELAPFEKEQAQLWHSVYLSADGEFIQIQLVNDNQQPFVFDIDPVTSLTNYSVEQDFQLHSMIIYAQPTSSGLQ
jgi:hypothetical protein